MDECGELETPPDQQCWAAYPTARPSGFNEIEKRLQKETERGARKR
jgi:hypothetical protein